MRIRPRDVLSRLILLVAPLLLMPPILAGQAQDIQVTQIGPRRTLARNEPWTYGTNNAANNYILTPAFDYERLTVYVQNVDPAGTGTTMGGSLAVWETGDPNTSGFASCPSTGAQACNWIQVGTTQGLGGYAPGSGANFTFLMADAASKLAINFLAGGTGTPNVNIFIVEAQQTASAGSGGSSSFTTAGSGYMIANGVTNMNPVFFSAANAYPITNYPAGTIVLVQFPLSGSSYTFRTASYNVSSAGAAGDAYEFCVYNNPTGSTLNLVMDSGAFNGVTTGLVSNTFSTPVTLVPGTYYFAYMDSMGTSSGAKGVAMQPGSAPAQLMQEINAFHTINSFTVSGAYTGTSCPGTIPVSGLTPITSAVTWQSIPLVVWGV